MRVARVSKLVSEVQRQESWIRSSQSAGKRQLEDQADDAVIVILDLSVKALAAFEDERLERLLDRRTLVADIGGSLS